MDFTKIELFLSLSETLNYSKTAEINHLSQPAVSKAIQSLESEINVRLFERDKHSVTLTEAGRIFYDDCRMITNLMDVAITRVQNISQKALTRLTLGYTGTNYEMKIMPTLIQRYKQKYSHVTISLVNSSHNNLKRQLADNLCDIIFLTLDDLRGHSDFRFEKIIEGEFVCVMHKTHKLAKRRLLSIADLDGNDIILYNTTSSPPLQARLQNDIKAACINSSLNYVDSINLSYALIKGNIGISVMPSFVTSRDKDISIIPIKYDTRPVYGIAVRKNFSDITVQEISEITKEIKPY